ncbi:MAG: T9SS type A sorting domain-containing protein [Candidatus Cloacimonetes bacterium]|nr:T9SS type A sorting domain-containing protein [Candidatus Cloacimonadota bacterium]
MPPSNNIIGEDPQLIDPENGDYRPAPGSPAVNYGCQTWGEPLIQIHNLPSISPKKDFGFRRSLIEVSGEIAGDEFWNADTIRVTGELSILSDAVLTIAPGTVVEFNDFYGIHVLGTIYSEGTVDEPILFISRYPFLFDFDEQTMGSWKGITFDYPSALNETSLFKYTTFEYAKALSSDAYGGALSIKGSFNLEIKNCIFRNNYAHYGAAIFTEGFANPVISGNLFYNNYALVAGSALYFLDSYPKVINNTIAGNTLLNDQYAYDTAVIHNLLSKPSIQNNIIWQNPTSFFEPIQIREGKPFYTSYNCIEEGYPGKGNISDNPMFFDFADCDYQLSELSPCIDSGFSSRIESYLEDCDLAGNQRIVDGSDDGISEIDIGAFEFQPYIGSENNNVESRVELMIYPNPFRLSSERTGNNPMLRFSLKEKTNVDIKIYDIKGRKVDTVFTGIKNFGNHEAIWKINGKKGKIASGIYFAVIKTDRNSSARKLIILK